MTTEEQILEILWDMGGEASINTIASRAKISIDYSRLVCKSLTKRNYISLDSGTAKLKGKGKLEAAKGKIGSSRQRIVVEPVELITNNKKKKIILGY